MDESIPLLDLAAARRLVQRHVGEGMQVIACWERPKVLYRVSFNEDEDDSDGSFYFAVVEDIPRRVGGTRHVAVDRRTGAVTELGMIGE